MTVPLKKKQPIRRLFNFNGINKRTKYQNNK